MFQISGIRCGAFVTFMVIAVIDDDRSQADPDSVHHLAAPALHGERRLANDKLHQGGGKRVPLKRVNQPAMRRLTCWDSHGTLGPRIPSGGALQYQ
ncbi:hypothetical protein AK812_SmicGene10920 [Symbiodinium microadriaticum]|uniref:Uncharacterized protein n=1 Tax=Symbiodinium microadriaticum TaxID=2951 RepID=A0A1Q9EES6_SYMMI|nr:hypothetical protein AK812_SmicGene10920 [Symbiodinium microadriaticum]